MALLKRDAALVALVLIELTVAACAEAPQDALGDAAIDSVRGDDNSVLERFYESSGEFEQAVEAFNTSPIDQSDALELADARLQELRVAFDKWTALVDEVIDLDAEGTPREELSVWRDAAGAWIAAQEVITEAMLACDYDPICLAAEQASHMDEVLQRTTEAQEAKRAFVAALPE